MEEYKLLYNKRRVISSQFIGEKMVISLEKENLKEKNKDYWCSKNIIDHLHSEWCITVDPNDSSLENCAITTCCLPLKIISLNRMVLTSPFPKEGVFLKAAKI